MTDVRLNESIIRIRVELQKANLKKSGKNKFAGFEYFELSDFLPRLNELMLEEGVNDRFIISENLAILELIKGDEVQIYQMPFQMFPVPLNKSGQPSMQEIQYLGALNTYYKRYLYLNAFGITDGEVIDSMNNDDVSTRKASPKQVEMLSKVYTGKRLEKLLTANNIESLEDISMAKASELISKLKEAEKKKSVETFAAKAAADAFADDAGERCEGSTIAPDLEECP